MLWRWKWLYKCLVLLLCWQWLCRRVVALREQSKLIKRLFWKRKFWREEITSLEKRPFWLNTGLTVLPRGAERTISSNGWSTQVTHLHQELRSCELLQIITVIRLLMGGCLWGIDLLQPSGNPVWAHFEWEGHLVPQAETSLLNRSPTESKQNPWVPGLWN